MKWTQQAKADIERGEKKCSGKGGCEQFLPLASFHLATSSFGVNHYRGKCRDCINGANRKRRLEDPEFREKEIANSKRWAEENKARNRKRKARWFKENQDKVSRRNIAYQREYRVKRNAELNALILAETECTVCGGPEPDSYWSDRVKCHFEVLHERRREDTYKDATLKNRAWVRLRSTLGQNARQKGEA